MFLRAFEVSAVPIASKDQRLEERLLPAAEVQFDYKEMAASGDSSSHRYIFDSIVCGKDKSIESDTAE